VFLEKSSQQSSVTPTRLLQRPQVHPLVLPRNLLRVRQRRLLLLQRKHPHQQARRLLRWTWLRFSPNLPRANKERLDWQKSIVDLMKLLNLDSSLAARKELADELHYKGDKNDTASMNIWLHKQEACGERR
jgi:hypothetical protein